MTPSLESHCSFSPSQGCFSFIYGGCRCPANNPKHGRWPLLSHPKFKFRIPQTPDSHSHNFIIRDTRQKVDAHPGGAPTGFLTEPHASHLASLAAASTQTRSTRPHPSLPPPPPPPATTTPLSLGSVGEVCGDGLLCGRCFSQPDFLTILCSDGILPNIPLLRMWWRFQQVMFDQFRGEPLPILLPTEALKSRCPISIDQIENILV